MELGLILKFEQETKKKKIQGKNKDAQSYVREMRNLNLEGNI